VAQTDFNFGFNVLEGRETIPTYECCGNVVCSACNKHHGYCNELTGIQSDRQAEGNLDFKPQRSSTDKRPKFENRDWIDPQKDLPKKGSAKWKVDAVRESKNKAKGILAFMDISNGPKKRVMSLRKGFTLDAIMDVLGTNSDRWIGKTLNLERGGSEGQYTNVAQ
jgi:hypothetical protein